MHHFEDVFSYNTKSLLDEQVQANIQRTLNLSKKEEVLLGFLLE